MLLALTGQALKKTIAVVFFLVFMTENLFASVYCYYVPCAPSVAMNSVVLVQQYEQKFEEMQKQLSEIESAYKAQYVMEDKLNTKLKQYEALKKEYLLLLDAIANQKREEINLLREAYVVK